MSGSEKHSKHLPPIEDHTGSALLDLERRSLDLLDLLIEHHGKDNETGMRADIPPKIAAQLKHRR
jgi:hypothetical protein